MMSISKAMAQDFLSQMQNLPERAKRWFQRLKVEAKIATAFSRAAATAAARQIDPGNPRTWEFSGFSQFGEDGVIDYLCSKLLHSNRFFFEIGSSDGLQNCSTWLALGRSYSGIMVDGDPVAIRKCEEMIDERVWNVHVIERMVDQENVAGLMKMCPYKDPDVFVIDIDGIDYYVLRRILELGFHPKIVVAEYNSAFGPDRSVTIPYRKDFSRREGHKLNVVYGVSVSAWRKLLGQYQYMFVTVESSGVNAFFVDPNVFPPAFADQVHGVDFCENVGDYMGAVAYRDADGDMVLPRRDWRLQQDLIKDAQLIEV
jgi:hypothetical protein